MQSSRTENRESRNGRGGRELSEEILDVRDMECPMPILMLKKCIEKGGCGHKVSVLIGNEEHRDSVMEWVRKKAHVVEMVEDSGRKLGGGATGAGYVLVVRKK